MKRFKWEIIVFLIYVFSRLPSIGHDNFNTDVWRWKTRTYDFSNGVFGLKFDQTLQKYHPGVTLMWAGTIGIKVYNLYSEIASHGVSLIDPVTQLFGLDAAQKSTLR